MTPALTLENLVIQRGSFSLGPLTHEFEKGKLHLIEGRNGSGKSTLLKTILGRLKLSSGDLRREEGPIGVVGIDATFIGSWSVEKNLQFLSGLLRKPVIHSEIPFRNFRFDHLSLGQRRKVELLTWFGFGLPIYLLDEALAPLDQAERSIFLAQIPKLLDSGSTILMTTHHNDEIPNFVSSRLELQ